MGVCCSSLSGRVANDPVRQNNLKSAAAARKSVKFDKGYDGIVIDDNLEEPENYAYYSFQEFLQMNTNPQICDWLFMTEIGKGAMSHVYLVKNTINDEICAAKVYNKNMLRKQTLRTDEVPIQMVNKEIGLMAQLGHRYLLSIIEVIEDDYTNSVILFIPYAQGGNVQSMLDKKKMTPEMICCCFHQVAVGLGVMHSKNVVHRDVKPENILCFQEDYYVLSDFSVSTQLQSDDEQLVDTRGSPAFLSPEECSGDPFYPKPTDVWAYGVSLYSALQGKLPFNLDCGQNRTLANIILVVTEQLETQSLAFDKVEAGDEKAIDLLTKLLDKDPKKRPTFDEIVNHPYFEPAWEIDRRQAELDETFATPQSTEISEQT